MQHLYDERLHEMLTYKRPYGSKTEIDWINKFIEPYKPLDIDDMALVVEVRYSDGSESDTLFSCHTDTVHRKDGRQKISYNPATQMFGKNDDEPLGADDAAGAWLMLSMIDAGVPGCYVFHRGEECGGVGSSWMAENHPDFLRRFKRAIAFDRRGTSDVITRQAGGRCCSDTFAESLSDALNEAGDLLYMPCDGGIYTDTAEYIELIPECTNVSVGYYSEHSRDEKLFVPHLLALRDACLKIDWDALPTERVPHKEDRWESAFSTTRSTKSLADVGSFDMMVRALKTADYDQMLDMAYEDVEAFVDAVYFMIHGPARVDSFRYDKEDGDDYFKHF